MAASLAWPPPDCGHGDDRRSAGPPPTAPVPPRPRSSPTSRTAPRGSSASRCGARAGRARAGANRRRASGCCSPTTASSCCPSGTATSSCTPTGPAAPPHAHPAADRPGARRGGRRHRAARRRADGDLGGRPRRRATRWRSRGTGPRATPSTRARRSSWPATSRRCPPSRPSSTRCPRDASSAVVVEVGRPRRRARARRARRPRRRRGTSSPTALPPGDALVDAVEARTDRAGHAGVGGRRGGIGAAHPPPPLRGRSACLARSAPCAATGSTAGPGDDDSDR